jgi:dTDP-4-dehydrorhamnose reductase
MPLYNSILITGGGGMLAHALNDLLLEHGAEPVVYTRAQLEITDDVALAHAFAEHKPSLLLNCAAHTKVDLCEAEKEKADAINGYAVGKMAALCVQYKTAMVHVSTDFVFDGGLRRPYRDDDPVNPVQAYGRSKLLGETELQKHDVRDWLIVRTAWVYGRHGVNFPRTMINAARAGKPLAVVADQVGSPTYTPDLAAGILALLDAGARGIWHVTGSGMTNWLEFAKAALEDFGLSNEIAPLTSEQWRQMRPNSAVRPPYTVLDTEAFAQATGRPMRNWREALRDFHAAVEREGF